MLYPATIKKEINQTEYQLTVVDLPGCQTKAETINIALQQIQEVMAEHLRLLAEYGEVIPQAKSVDQHMKLVGDPTIIWAVIEFDITPYLGKSHKINVTLPELLIKQIDDRVGKISSYKSRSGFIAKACLQEIAKRDNTAIS